MKFCHADSRITAHELLKQKVKAENSDLHYAVIGKPYFKEGPYFSISHTTGAAVCAYASTPIGVDIERKRHVTGKMIDRICSTGERLWIYSQEDPEAAFFQLWTLKEAYIKYLGLGLQYPVNNTDFKKDSCGKWILPDTDLMFLSSVQDEHYLAACCISECSLILE